MAIRQPIVTVLGHVDSGKTSILDYIRDSGIQKREAGGITQHIGASFLPTEIIKKICGSMFDKMEKTSKVNIPGILVIDTPGHEVFKNLRTRGGSAADIAILVVDTNRGFQPQTNESLKILESRKVPFVVALNKVDQIPGWQPTDTSNITTSIKAQPTSIQTTLDEQIYGVVGTLSVLGYKSEAFYRVQNFAEEVSIVPVSAKTGVGIPELLIVLVGLARQFLQKRLDQSEKRTRGIVLEVNDEVGLGTTVNIILIDGILHKDDMLVFAKRDEAISIKPKAILLPKPLDEMRDIRDKLKSVEQVVAAAGVKIVSPDLDGVLPGSTLYVVTNSDELQQAKKEILAELKSIFVETEVDGIILKCDTIGSLEAIVSMLQREKIPIAKADIGNVTHNDVMQAKVIKENDRHLGVIMAFNVKILLDAQKHADEFHIRIFEDKIIYSLIDSYTQWAQDDARNVEDSIFSEIPLLSKFTFLKDHQFRNNDPAVFGIRVDVGTLKQKTPFMNKTGKRIGTIHQLQAKKKNIDTVKTGGEAACSVQGVTIGRQVHEEDVYYSLPTSNEAKQLLNKFSHKLAPPELELLYEIVEIQRIKNAAYGY